MAKRAQEEATNPTLEAFAKELRSRRKFFGMSQSRLAELAGTTQATVSAVEAAKGNPSINLLTDLADVFKGEPVIMLRNKPVKPHH